MGSGQALPHVLETTVMLAQGSGVSTRPDQPLPAAPLFTWGSQASAWLPAEPREGLGVHRAAKCAGEELLPLPALPSVPLRPR